MKNIIVISILLLWCVIAYANEIDTLSSKESVKKFLWAKLGTKGIYLHHRCEEISKTAFMRIYNFDPDTIYVTAPVTYETIRRIMPHEPNYPDDKETKSYFLAIDYLDIDLIMDNTPYSFYKVDVDGNGYTDILVDIDTTGFFIMMDFGDEYEGYILSDISDFHSYSFVNTIKLSDNSTALLLRRNPCTETNSRPYSLRHKGISYTIDTITNSTDVTYYAFAIADTAFCCNCENSHEVTIIYDTVDTRRYNIIDTIVYKFNGFLKCNNHYKLDGISKIVYQNDYKDQHCTSMEIRKNGQCFLGITVLDTILTAIVDSTELTSLWNLIAYLDIKSDTSHTYYSKPKIYNGNIFTIYFDDGTIKKISYWDYPPSPGLYYVSRILAGISSKVNWKISKNATGFKCICDNPYSDNFILGNSCR